jgi:asparagine synthase (glutamine-hydrolysing)
MCGINGIYTKTRKDKSFIDDDLKKMNDLIIHRGPDDDGVYSHAADSYSIAMGMRRLSIIDLQTGKQPISSEDLSKTIVFNGEIYNYKALRNELAMEGTVFKTHSDTEVILKLYEKFGTDSFSMLDGMFAFSIYDKSIDKIYIARDYFGEKPLYYTKVNNKFYWASELKSIKKILPFKPNLSKEAISLFFQLTYIPAPFSIYQDIFKLKPNHFIKINCINGSIDTQKINTSKTNTKSVLSFPEAKRRTHDLVYKSVTSRAVSDVPIGSFLSGGVDSSIVSLCLSKLSDRPIQTFSIGFEKKSFDETEKSQVIAKLIGSKHHEFIVSLKDIRDEINAVILNFDEPFADSSALPTYMVSKLTHGHVKVVLTGDGGDEVFGGYNKYYMGQLNNRYTSIVPNEIHEFVKKTSNKILNIKNDNRGYRFKLNKALKAIDYNHKSYYNIISLGFQAHELNNLFFYGDANSESVFNLLNGGKAKSIHDFRNIDKNISLEGDLLVKVDRTSMLCSIECRSPFLNKELWDFTNELPENFLLKGFNKKYILKEAFKDYFPKKFLDKQKKGFGVPVGDWLREDLKNEIREYIEISFLKKQSIFNVNYTIKMVDDHIEGKVDNTFKVWSFYCFQKWYVNNYIS